MGHVEAQKLPVAPSLDNVEVTEDKEPVSAVAPVRPQAPTWMDAAVPNVTHRRGVIPAASRSGMGTFTFFALIVLSVAAAGIFAVSVWGPDKTPKNRTQFATNPAPPPTLPSLPEETSPAALPAAESSASPAGDEAATAAPVASATQSAGTKAKKVQRPYAKKAR